MLAAVIFDFDGVISDSEKLHYKAARDVFAPLGVGLTWERYFQDYIVYTDAECFEAIVRDFDLSLTADEIDGLIDKKEEIFVDIAKQQSTIYDGVVEFIELLKNDSIRMAICSGASFNDIATTLEGTVLEDAFELIVSADDVTRGKPDPEPYLLTLQRLNDNCTGLTSSNCIVVEDTHGGIKAAKAAGLKCLGVTNTYDAGSLANSADMVVDRLDKVTLAELNALLGVA